MCVRVCVCMCVCLMFVGWEEDGRVREIASDYMSCRERKRE